MNKQSREELKRLAEAATQGPWLAKESWQSSAIKGHHCGKWDIRNDECASNAFKPIGQFHGDKRLGMNGERDAKFVATANPAAILSLLAYVDRLEAQRDWLLSALKDTRSIVEIHSDATDNNFAWAEMAESSAAITEAESEQNIIEALEIGESLCASEAEAVLAREIRELWVELMAKQQHLAGAFSRVHEAEKEADYLREQLAQERKRLDWALSHDAMYYKWDGVWWFHWTMSYDVTDMIETDNPRATIDELIAAEAAGDVK